MEYNNKYTSINFRKLEKIKKGEKMKRMIKLMIISSNIYLRDTF